MGEAFHSFVLKLVKVDLRIFFVDFPHSPGKHSLVLI